MSLSRACVDVASPNSFTFNEVPPFVPCVLPGQEGARSTTDDPGGMSNSHSLLTPPPPPPARFAVQLHRKLVRTSGP